MGRGDKKSKRGKIFRGSFGKTRPKPKKIKKKNQENNDKKENKK